MSTSDGSTASNILTAALCHMRDRAATYDKPEGERSMGATVDAFHAVTGVSMTEEQGWLFMALLKAVRSQQGAYRADSYEDGAAYFALAGEAAVRDRAVKESLTVHPVHPATFDHIDPADVEISEHTSFEFAPDWANWTGQDADGTWYWFSARPQPFGNGWATDRKHVEITSVRTPNKDWFSTLAARPIK